MTGRDRRLAHEYQELQTRYEGREDIRLSVTRCNAAGIPDRYLVEYHIRSLCGVENAEYLGEPGYEHKAQYAETFVMEMELPHGYPSIDAQPLCRFLTTDAEGNPIPHPWHPNIRWYGAMAGRVCLNAPDSYTPLAWYVTRVAQYLRWECYHATNEPPYPEDLKVARWVLEHEKELNIQSRHTRVTCCI